jgi:uncharacterized repeat protein (TIGR02543 family)
MHAQWRDEEPTPIQYTLIFNSHGGSPVEGLTAEEGTAVSKPADPTRAGYAFTGWFSAAYGGTLYSWPHTLTANVTMYAQWQVLYTITFNSRGGSAVAAITAEPGTAVPKPGDPARSGYIFQGWYNMPNGGTLYTWPHTLTANVPMHAHWTVDPNGLGVTLTVSDFSSRPDPAGSALSDTSFTLTKPGGTKTISVSGSEDDTAAVWYIGLAKIWTGSSVTLSAADLSLGTHTLRVTAVYGGVRYSKDITFTVNE